MRKTYEEKVTLKKCDCCKRLMLHEKAWIVEVEERWSNGLQKRILCKACYPTKEHAEAVARELDAYFSCPPTEG